MRARRSDVDGEGAPTEPRRIGGLAATSLVVANMVGTGVFVTSGYLARSLGDPSLMLAVWVVGGVLALSGATVYAELGAMMPRAGGEYVYLSRAFHPAVGFLSGWVSLWVGFSAPIAAAATACAYYADAVVPLPSVRGAAVLLILATSVLHMASVTWGARAQTVFTAVKLALLVAFVGAACLVGRGSGSHFSPSPHDVELGTVASALVFVAFAYSGWNAASYVAGELADPGRTLPRALVVGTSLVTFLYVAIEAALLYALPPHELGAHPTVVVEVAASALFGEGTGRVVAASVALALVSSVSAMTMAGPRVYVAMAEDGLFFRALARRSRTGAPWASIATQSALAIVLVLTAGFEDLLRYVGFTLSVFSALTVIGAVVLRVREPDAPRPYRAFLWPWSALCFVALSLWIVVFSIAERPIVAFAGALTLLAGLVFYVPWSRSRTSRRTL